MELTMSNEANFWTYISDAGLVVKFVMLALTIASIYSWTIIVQRYLFLKHADETMTKFEESFWSGVDMTNLFSKMRSQAGQLFGLENIFYSGFDAFVRMSQSSNADPKIIMENVNRAMRSAIGKDRDVLEKHLSALATIGSVSPYVGLFGTVWGIMATLKSMGSMQQATIATVAPGISEALIATAMGLFAAIPAYIAYNRFVSFSDRLTNRYETFHDDFYAVLQRQTHARVPHASA
jgi:biopolymer transport protein TolQ